MITLITIILIVFLVSACTLFVTDTDKNVFSPIALMLLFLSTFGIWGIGYRNSREYEEQKQIKSHQSNQILNVDSAKVEIRNDTIYMTLRYHKP